MWKFKGLSKRSRGMMNARTYLEIYRRVLPLPDLDIVEVGAAGGAATVSIGWAMKKRAHKSKIVVIEKC